jgi:hypothetical protein
VKYGLQSFEVGNFRRSEVFSIISLWLNFKDWRSQVEKMNETLLASKAKARQFSDAEFLIGLLSF